MSATLGFWLIAAALVAGAVACVLVPVLRPAEVRRRSIAAVNADVLRGQLADLERDTALGVLAPMHLAQARDELQRRVLDEAADRPTSGRALPRWLGPVVIGVALPIAAIGSYAALGAPAAVEAARLMANAESGHALTARLQQHLRDEPRDGRAWVLLARSYAESQNFAEAADAYQRALAVAPKVARDPAVLCEYADVLGMTQGGTLAGKPAQLIAQALSIDSEHPLALEMAGSAAYEQRRYSEAAQHWSALLAHLPAASARHGELSRAIERAQRKAAVSLSSR